MENSDTETFDDIPTEKENKVEQFDLNKQQEAIAFDGDELFKLADELSVRHGVNREKLFTVLKEFLNSVKSNKRRRKKEAVEVGSDANSMPPQDEENLRWSFSSSLLFAFTILTTIGYGNVVPSTFAGRLFTIFYALFGIPLFLIALTDLGSFVKSTFSFAYHFLTQLFKKRNKAKVGTVEKEKDEEDSRKSQHLSIIMDFLLIIVIFITFILLGATVLPWWEEDLSTFNAAYYTFISISTIGLGDIVPQNMQFLPLTLLYITIGLWLTTIVIEKISDVFKLVHYAGRRMTNIDNVNIWLGGKKLTVGDVIMTVALKTGVPEHELMMINWDKTINDAADGILPPEQPNKISSLPSLFSSLPVTPLSFRKTTRDFPPIDADEFAISESNSLMDVIV
uniref:Potassium channel domain-containing protein n=1 Tax=Plectus sambesii TaxID=2011161 RepID=A0A914VT55_9BILA